MEILREAKSRRYSEWEKVAENARFEAVRDRADFKTLTAP